MQLHKTNNICIHEERHKIDTSTYRIDKHLKWAAYVKISFNKMNILRNILNLNNPNRNLQIIPEQKLRCDVGKWYNGLILNELQKRLCILAILELGL